MKLYMRNFLFLFSVLIVSVILYYLNINILKVEGFDNNILATPGDYPKSLDGPELNFYPLTNNNGVSNNNASNMWWHYPIFKVGSYKQITNNIRYPNNPDEGTCMPAEFCGALYKDRQLESNIVEPLPPVPECPGARVNYYRSDSNLLPFNNEGNILY